MNLNQKKRSGWNNNPSGKKKCLLVMRNTFMLLLAGTLHVSAINSIAYSQTARLSVEVNNTTVGDVLHEIEEQSEFYFTYNSSVVNTKRVVSIDMKNRQVNEILDELFAGENIGYSINDKHIVLYKKDAASISVVQQSTKRITGTVVDASGVPVIGANVMVKGTSNGTITDMDGKFTLEVSDGAVLEVSYIGYLSQTIKASGKSISVILKEDTQKLDEVVVIGYGSRSKKDITGAVSQIDSDEITKQVSMSPEMSLQGKMPGVFISNPGSDPTARPEIRIRGVGTLGFNDPLYVIDGVPLTEGGASSSDTRSQDQRGTVNVFSMINPNDIESISVLKDASATAIYGVRASNGVVLITTKRGKEGKARVDLSMSYGIQNIFKRYDVVSMQEYVDMSLEAINANPAYQKDQYFMFFDKTSPQYLGNNIDYREDWLDAALNKNAAVQDYNISVSGGNKSSTYATGVGYSNQDNVLGKDNYERYSFYVNSDHQVTDWLKVGESFRFVYTNHDDFTNPDFQQISFMMPWQPLYDSNNESGLAYPGRTIDGKLYPYGYGQATINNFLGSDLHQIQKREMMRNLGSLYFEVKPFEKTFLKGLKFKGTVSLDYYTNKQKRYLEPERGLYEVSKGVEYVGEGNQFRLRNSENINLVKEFTIAYNNTFNKHSFDVILNGMAQNIQWNLQQQAIEKNSPITSWDQHYINEGWPSENKTNMYERNNSGLIGYMGRLSYNYSSKYYFDFTVRRDGTSKFAPGYKWGTFPSFAAAWRVSSEKFMQNFKWLDDLKIRGGWGKTGNQETRSYAYLSLVNTNPKAAFGSIGNGNGNIYQAIALGDLPIQDMSWETVTTYSLGFDMVSLGNKLNATVEYYNRKTDGILQTINVPLVVGILNNPVVNLAQVYNSGFEFSIGYNDRFGKVGFNASVNLTTVKNRVENMYNGKPTQNGNHRIENGYSMNYIYGYKTDGIFQTQQEVDDWMEQNNDIGYSSQKAPGDVRYVDLYGAPNDNSPQGALKDYNPDGKIDEFDQTYLGKTIPGYYFGINLGADYNNFDISLSFRGVGDVQKINTLGVQSIQGGGQNFLSDYRDRWTEDNKSSLIPRAIQQDPSGNNRISDRHVQNAGFIRLQNLQVGYTFKPQWMQKINISRFRLYVSGSNLFVLSPYKDLDPENITTPTTFTIGANVSF